jgi:hypothetical protein
LKLNSESRLSEDSIIKKVAALERQRPLAKAMFDRTCERWRGLLYALHKDDREQLLRMLVDCCTSLDEGAAAKMLINSESSISVLFLFWLVWQNQKLINRINKSTEKSVKAGSTLLDFID